MVYESFYRDFFWEQYGVDSLEYWLAYEGTPIFVGKAFKSPDASCIRINVSRILRDYIWNDMPDFRPIDGDFVSHPDALKKFDLYDGTGTLLEEYVVYFSFEDFNLPELTYRGIDGWADPRQKIFFPSTSDIAWTQSYDVSELYFNIDNVMVPKEGGLIHLYYETNMKDYQYYFGVSSGITVSSYGGGRLSVTVPENTTFSPKAYTITVYDTDGNVITTCVLTQMEAEPEFTCDDFVNLPIFGGNGTIHFETNIPPESITYTLPAGVSGVSISEDGLVISVGPASGGGIDDYVVFYFNGNEIGRARVYQTNDYFNCDSVLYVTSNGGVVYAFFDTNIPLAEITCVLPAEFTLSSLTSGTLVFSVPQNDGGEYSRTVTYKRGAYVLGTTSVVVGAVNQYKGEYFTIEALGSGSLRAGSSATPPNSVEYSKNGGEWHLANGNVLTSVVEGDKVRVRAWPSDGKFFGGSAGKGFYITGDVKFNAYGNVMSLLNYVNYQSVTEFSAGTTYNLAYLFCNSDVVDASGLYIPPTIALPGSFSYMFMGCKSLEKAPEFYIENAVSPFEHFRETFEDCSSLVHAPRMVINNVGGKRSYYRMFRRCTSLVDAPVFNTAHAGEECFYAAFSGCTSLVNCQTILPFTTNEKSACEYMFLGCTSLQKAPVLYSDELSARVYYSMFNGCTSLNYVKCLATVNTVGTNGWLNNVANNGTFVKSRNAAWTTGSNGIPSGWTVIEE